MIVRNALVALILLAIILEVVIVIGKNRVKVNTIEKISNDKIIENLQIDPVSLYGYSLVNVTFIPGKIVLSKDCVGMAIVTTVEKSHSIQRGDDVLDIRPNEHDLIRDIIDGMNINPLFASLDRIDRGIYYASIVLETEDNVLRLDSKPSDALALSTRLDIPVYVANDILINNGQKVC